MFNSDLELYVVPITTLYTDLDYCKAAFVKYTEVYKVTRFIRFKVVILEFVMSP